MKDTFVLNLQLKIFVFEFKKIKRKNSRFLIHSSPTTHSSSGYADPLHQ